jgi:NTE family protein
VPATELQQVMATLDHRRFRDAGGLARFGLPGQLLSLATRNGIYQGDERTSWLRARLAEHDVRTFADLRGTDPGTSLPPEQDVRLVVMASDLSHGALRRLPWDHGRYGRQGDEVEVADAVRSSMSIPYVYRPVKLRDRVTDEDAWLVDGGMLDTMSGFYDRIHLDDPAVVARIIFVDTMQVRATDFDLDRATQQALFDRGRRAAERFLDGTADRPAWDFDADVERFRSPSDGDGAGG